MGSWMLLNLLLSISTADSAGGVLPLNPIEEAENAIVEAVKQQAQVNAKTQAQADENLGNLADSISEEAAAKLAALFKDK